MPTMRPRRRPVWNTLASLGLLSGLALAPQAHALDIDLRTGVDFSTWSLLGDARTLSTPALAGPGGPQVGIMRELVLTDAIGDRTGAAYAPGSLVINFNQDFSFQFHAFLYGSELRGDGMAFVITTQMDPQAGGGGTGLGYERPDLPGYAFAIDTFHFEDEPVSPSLQILRDGSITPVAATETGLGDTVRNLQSWTATVEYVASGNLDEAGTLSATIFRPDLGSFSVSSAADWSGFGAYEVDDEGNYLGRRVRYGFTAATGAASDGHLVASLAPVPEPQTAAMLLAGLVVMGTLMRRRSGSGPI